MKVKVLITQLCPQLFVTPWTVARQAPLSMARILEWAAISSSRGFFPTLVSCIAGRFVYCLSHQGSLNCYNNTCFIGLIY